MGLLAATGILVASSAGADQHGARVIDFTIASRYVHQTLPEVAVTPPGSNGSGRPLLVFLHGKGSDGQDSNLNSAMFAALDDLFRGSLVRWRGRRRRGWVGRGSG